MRLRTEHVFHCCGERSRALFAPVCLTEQCLGHAHVICVIEVVCVCVFAEAPFDVDERF